MIQQSARNTDLLRFLAILLIVNSHLDPFLPSAIAKFATGGMLGNALFFMLSAFGLFMSYKERRRNLIDYYSHRILRIYPSIWIVLTLILLPLCLYDNEFAKWMCNNQIEGFIQYYFLPKSPFWFLQALMLFYFVIYFILKNYSRRLIGILGIISLIVYSIFYFNTLDLSRFTIEDYPFKLIFYFLVILFGLFLAENNDKIKYDGFTNIIYFVVGFTGIYLHKYFLSKGFYGQWQFTEHLFTFVTLYSLFKVSKSQFIHDRFLTNKTIAKPIAYWGGLTLEIYLAHACLSNPILKLGIAFPYNILIFISASIMFAVFIHKVAVSMERFMKNA